MAAEPPAAAPDPDDITPQDRFFLGGRSLSFRDFVAACMPAFPPREEIVPAPPPAPAPARGDLGLPTPHPTAAILSPASPLPNGLPPAIG